MKQVALALVLIGCGDDGVMKLPDAPVVPDSPPIDAPVCAPITGAGTMHLAGINAPETWTAAGSPHIVRTDTSVTAAVTIEACALVQIGGDKSLTVRATGSLTANGMPGLPVRFERLDPNDSWATISALGGGTLSLTHTTITGGGDPLNTIPAITGALDISGNGVAPVFGALHVDHVTITGSDGQGVNLHQGGGFDATSTDLTISGSANAPIVTYARSLGTIPSGTYTGNGLDEIVIRGTGGNEAIGEAVTMHNRGVPYRVGINANAVLDVASLTGTPASLTIEPGVTLKFLPTAHMRIDASSGTTPASGALIAVGTATQPIIFTSAAATPAPGDWWGIWLGRQPLPATRLDHVHVLFAGKTPSGSSLDSCVPMGQVGPNDAAIRIAGGLPTSVFITNTTITNSARHGIDLGYRSDTKLDFLTPNPMITVPGCRTTLERDLSGACPTLVPCN